MSQISLDDFIEATKEMDGIEYYHFMELPIEQRLEIAEMILKERCSVNKTSRGVTL